MSTPVGVIKKFVKALVETNKQGTAAVDEAFKAVGATSYSAFKSKFNTAKSDLSMDTFLKEQCGIRLTNSDTGAITGSDADGKIVKTDESIVPETAAAKELTAAEYNSFTKNGLKVNVIYKELDDDEVDEEFGYSAATYLAKQKLVVKALYNWWIPESLNLINESFGSNFNDKLANIYKFDVKFEGANNSNYPVELDFDYDNKGYAFEVTLRIDPNLLYNITANDKNGKLPTDYSYDGKYGVVSDSYGSWDDAWSAPFTSYLDRLILQAMAEVTLKANVPYFYKLPLGIRTGLIELVGGYDSGEIDANNFYDNAIDDDGTGYVALRYLAKNYSDGMPDSVSYNADKTALTVTNEFTEKTLDLADFESTVKNVNASALKRGIQIVGNKLANSIRSGSGNDTLSGGEGNDSLWGGSGNDSLKGGDGNDVFIYSAGNDVISDYVVGQDKIKLSNASITSSTVSGSDLVLTLNSGKITVKGGKDKNITVIDAKGNESTKKYGTSTASTLMTVTNSTTSPVSIGSAVKTVDASSRTTAIKLTGNALANSIKGGSGNDTYSGGDGNDSLYGGNGNDVLYGQAGNDKLYGQSGNDSLYGGAGNDSLSGGDGNDYLKGGDGNDVFIYSAGNDVIADYVVGQDKIKLSNASIKSASVSGDNVILTLDTGKLTVTGGKDKNITVIDAKGNETTKKYGTTSGGGKTLTVTKNATLGSDYQNADASKLTKAVKIVGNKSANVILGGSKNDTLYGESGNDSILGNAGNDVLYGGFGNDTLKGGDANDKLFGGAGADKLYGGKGDDTLIGGAGNDSLWGNDGSDTFIYNSGDGKDVIFGFDSNDTLTLDSMDFTATYKNNVVTISFDEGSVTLKDFGSTKTFNINDETYQISGSKFVKK